jgi:hypothetical protein
VRHDKKLVFARLLFAALSASGGVALALRDALHGDVLRVETGLVRAAAGGGDDDGDNNGDVDLARDDRGELLSAVFVMAAGAAVPRVELVVVDGGARVAQLRSVGNDVVSGAYALLQLWCERRGLPYGGARPVPSENATNAFDAFRFLLTSEAAGPSERALHAGASARLLDAAQRGTVASTDVLTWLFVQSATRDEAAFDMCLTLVDGDRLTDDAAVVALLHEALGKRIKHAFVRRAGTQVLVAFDAERCFSIVDRGPSTDQEAQAERFRALWGEKAEVRRFRDGSVQLAVTWTDAPRQEVMFACVSHLLALHFGVRCAPSQQSPLAAKAVDQTSAAAWQVFDRFVGELRALPDMPLALVSAQPIAPLMRYAETRGAGLHVWSAPIDVVLRFEASGAWPTEIDAIEAVKQSLLIRIAERLRRTKRYAARACLEFVDVVVDQLPFRLHILQPYQQQLLRERFEKLSADADARDDASLAAEARAVGERLRKMVALGSTLPALSAALLSFARVTPSYSDAVRMFKAWLSAHMLADLLDEFEFGRGVVAELLVVRAFVYAGAHASAPVSAVAAFARTLELLADTTPTDALLVPFHAEPDRGAVHDALRARDESSAALFVYPLGIGKGGGDQLTARVPERVVARRLSLLAKASVGVLPAFDVCVRPSLTEFDHVFRVDKAAVRAVSQRALFDFDPVRQLVQALRERFGLHALFFYDDERRHAICVAWRERRQLRVYATAPLILEMERMAGDLLKKP